MTLHVSPPRSPPLLHEWHHWSWFHQAWGALPSDSRHQYDEWVAQARSPRQARRRANVVARRAYTGRAWAGRTRRILQGLLDYSKQAPDMPDASHGTVSS